MSLWGFNMNFKLVAIIIFLLLLTACGSQAEPPGTKKMDKKIDEKMMRDIALRRKFADLQDNPAYLIIKVKNINEQMDLVCTNAEWWDICLNDLKFARTYEEYRDYMFENSDKVFELDDDLYEKLKKYKADDSYVNKYKTKEQLQKGIQNGDFGNATDKELANDRAFIKLLLQYIPVLRLDPETGTVFEDVIRVDNNFYGEEKPSKETLKERFGDFSTSPTFVLVNIKNSKTKETAEIVCENEIWFDICSKHLKIVKNSKNYASYMVGNYTKVFEIQPEIYNALKKDTKSNMIELLKLNTVVRKSCLDGSIVITKK